MILMHGHFHVMDVWMFKRRKVQVKWFWCYESILIYIGVIKRWSITGNRTDLKEVLRDHGYIPSKNGLNYSPPGEYITLVGNCENT